MDSLIGLLLLKLLSQSERLSSHTSELIALCEQVIRNEILTADSVGFSIFVDETAGLRFHKLVLLLIKLITNNVHVLTVIESVETI